MLRGRQRKGIALVAGISLALTLVQWALHVLAAGVSLPPGGVEPWHARRWLQELRSVPITTTLRSKRILVPLSPAHSAISGTGVKAGNGEEQESEPEELYQSPSQVPTSSLGLEPHEHTRLLPSPHSHFAHATASPEGASCFLHQQRGWMSSEDELSASSDTECKVSHDPEQDALGSLEAQPTSSHDSARSDDLEGSTRPEEEGWDTDDIVDIAPDRRVGRKLSTQRLALAYADDQDPQHWRASFFMPPPPLHRGNHLLPARSHPVPSPLKRSPHSAPLRAASERWSASAPTDAADSILSFRGNGERPRARTHSAAPVMALREEGPSA